MGKAHDQAVREAEAFVRNNPEFGDLLAPDLQDSGEVSAPERSDLMGARRGMLGYPEGDLLLAELVQHATPLWSGRSRTLMQRLLDVRMTKLMDMMQVKERNLLDARFMEGLELEEIGAREGVSYQAVQQRIDTALYHLALLFVTRGHEVAEVSEEEV